MTPSLPVGGVFVLRVEESWDRNSENLVEFVEKLTIEAEDFHVFAQKNTGRRFWVRPRYVEGSVEAIAAGAEVVVGVFEPPEVEPKLQEIWAAYSGIGTIRGANI